MKTPLHYVIVLFTIMFFIWPLQAHDTHYGHHDAPTWTINGKPVHGFFYYFKDGKVFLEDEHQELHSYRLNDFAEADRNKIQEKIDKIEQINVQLAQKALPPAKSAANHNTSTSASTSWVWVIGIASVLLALFLGIKMKIRAAVPALLAMSIIFLYNFVQSPKRRLGSVNDPIWMDSAFAPFRPAINTRWDNTWFYVESKGIPAHMMMTGITSWQQQVPIPQCYIGSNAWSVPLNPVKAAVPIPVNNKHFLRGAVAIAANGIPIFNPYTNTGVDAFLDGQLDQWGGHSGRADDYHYHIAPMFLEAKSGRITPIGFALDGYGIYGAKEPDGTAMAALDANHGHTWKDGRYHYHGTAAAPYMIGNMVGQVTEDTTLQIVPQAVAKGVRPALTPLKGATITGFHENGNNGYTLIYTLPGATDSIVYSWNQAGNFTYNFYASGVKTTNNYNGKPLCEVPGRVRNVSVSGLVKIYPNPTSDRIFIQLENQVKSAEIQWMELYNNSGVRVYRYEGFTSDVPVSGLSTGIYWLKMKRGEQEWVNKVVLQ
jgi:hypothetical protein